MKSRKVQKPGKWKKLFSVGQVSKKVSAYVIKEDDWHTDVPNVKLMRAFVVILILHVVALGGIFMFRSLNSEEQDAVTNITPSTAANREVAPGATASPAKPDELAMARSRSYKVRLGDTLQSIAVQFEVSTDSIAELNQLGEGHKLYAGQLLLIPNRTIRQSTPSELNTLLGNAPETPAPAAEKPAPPIQEVTPLPANAPATPVAPVVVENQPRPAQPKPAAAPAPTRPRPAAQPAPRDPAPAPQAPAQRTYVVQAGDNPYAIARKFGVSYKSLMHVNKIDDPTKLQIGQKLIIPAK